MVKTINDITEKNFNKLSILVSTSGLSFCITHLVSNHIINFTETSFSDILPIEEQLWKAFLDYPLLSKPFDEIEIVHNNALNSFVPASLFNKEYLASYLQYNTKVFETDFFTYDFLENYNLYNVYVPYAHINNFLLDHFKTFEYQNSNTVLVKKLLNYNLHNFVKTVYVHIQENNFEIVVLNHQELLFFNSFAYKTAQDFLYYLLFTLEQLQINPDNGNVVFLGKIKPTSDIFLLSYNYIRNCEIIKLSHIAKVLQVSEQKLIENFILFQS